MTTSSQALAEDELAAKYGRVYFRELPTTLAQAHYKQEENL
jgi:hypothetical protein